MEERILQIAIPKPDKIGACRSECPMFILDCPLCVKKKLGGSFVLTPGKGCPWFNSR